MHFLHVILETHIIHFKYMSPRLATSTNKLMGLNHDIYRKDMNLQTELRVVSRFCM